MMRIYASVRCGYMLGLLHLVCLPLTAIAGASTNITVIDDSSGRPLSDVRLELVDRDRVLTGFTDSQGHSTLSLSGGTYCVRAEISGYVDPLVSAAAHCHRIESGGRGLVLRLVRSCEISGVIMDDQGVAVEEARVVALGLTDNRETQSIAQATLTDDNGAYRLFGLMPGRYSVAVFPSGQDTTLPPFVPTFLGSRNFKQAEMLTLHAGDARHLADVVVDVHGIARSTLRGNVSDPCFSQGCRVAVMLFSRNGVIGPIDERFTDKNGDFTFEDVPVGDYFLGAWTPVADWPASNQFPVSIKRAAMKPVSVNEPEDIVSLQLLSTVTVTGRVGAGDQKRISDACPDLDQVSLQSEDGWPSLWISPIESENTVHWGPLPAGTYRIGLPPGESYCDLTAVVDAQGLRQRDQRIHVNTDTNGFQLWFAPLKRVIPSIVHESPQE